MAKQFFKNLPDTSTPLTAPRLNGLLDGEESMGDLVVDSIRSKNMFDKSTIVAGDITGSNTGNRLSSRQVIWLDAGTYTFSCNIESPYRYGILVQNTGVPPLSSATTYIYDAGWKTASNPTTTFTINTAGWVTISFSKEDSSALTPSDVTGFNYQLEKGSVATTYSPYQNLDGQEIYSTGEVKIGTWMGKPFYRKVFTITSLTTSNTNLVDVSGLSIDFAKISGTIITSIGAKFPINLYDSAANYSVIFLSDAGYIRGRGTIGSGTLTKCMVILEYTKTTD